MDLNDELKKALLNRSTTIVKFLLYNGANIEIIEKNFLNEQMLRIVLDHQFEKFKNDPKRLRESMNWFFHSITIPGYLYINNLNQIYSEYDKKTLELERLRTVQ
jgi:hypothetical protein